MSRNSLSLLPEEVLIHVLSFCDMKDLIRVSMVSRLFYELHCEESLWRKFYLETYEFDPEYDYKLQYIDSVVQGKGGDLWMFQRKKSGQRIGKVLSLLGVGSLGAMLSPIAGPGLVAMGLGGLIGGAWMYFGGYYNDPEALEEYYSDFEENPLIQTIQKYSSFDKILKICGRGNVERGYIVLSEKITSEVPIDRLELYFDTYNLGNLKTFVEYGVLSRDLLKNAFLRDLDLEKKSDGPAIRIVGKLIDAVLYIGFTKDYIKDLLSNDYYTIIVNWPVLFKNNVYHLVDLDCIELNFVKEKCLAEFFMVNNFQVFETRYTLDFLHKGIVEPIQISSIFTRDVIRTKSLSEIYTKYNSLIKKHQSELVDPFYLERLNEFFEKYEKLHSTYNTAVSDIQTEYFRRKANLKDQIKDESEIDSKFKRKMRNLDEDEENEIDNEKRIFQVKVENIDLNWKLFIAENTISSLSHIH